MPLTGVPEIQTGGLSPLAPPMPRPMQQQLGTPPTSSRDRAYRVTRLQEIESTMVLFSQNAIFVPLSTFGNQQSCFVNDNVGY